MKIAVIDYHKGNLKSVERGLAGVGADARITDDPAEIAAADALVLPGVGAFTDAAESMRALGQMDPVRERVLAGVPFLGICLGMHLMFEAGTEHAPGAPTPGLGLIAGVADALPRIDADGRAYKIPHVGWNSVEFAGAAGAAGAAGESCALFEGIPDGEYFYFTHSFAAPASSATVATTRHSIAFPSVVQVPGLPACFGVQFHPEKSSDAGAALLRNFVKTGQNRS